ncbi:unnamed protein product [Adineta steineri]|uniref:Uncharacterized protein n=1 Tax=Adineta steineri TaxID=433720 RepID=A0A814EUV1_9BILA|nr:unnamed protein product [Adineta steineri]
MYCILIVLFILTNGLLSTTDIQPCLSRSLEQIFLDYTEQKFDCSSLPSQIQTTLALHFTFCHLNSTGINSNTICSLTLSNNNNDINECLQNITKNSFAYLTYTNFIPHIQSICYAIETQQWHNQAQDQLASNSELLVIGLLQLLDGCPPENVQLRKDIIVAARHFLSSDLRTLFVPHVKRFFDENLLLSIGYTARETLKPLAYNTFGDFFNHIRTNLSIEDLQSVLYMYSKMIHDSSLPPSIQVMSLKFLTNIAESIRQKGTEKSRDLLIRIVEILIFKCKSLAKQCTHLSNSSNEKSTTPTIPLVPEVDVTTSTINELVQNMNDITNREKELQRQQLSQVENEAKNLLIEQDRMQTSLDQALIVNQHSVDDALNVDRFLQVAQSDVEELQGHLYVKDKAQIELIQQILETLFNIQTSLFVDAFGLSSYVFYAASLIGIYLLTIPERTNASKFWLILLWLSLIGIERYTLFFSSYSHVDLYNALWRLRQLWFFISCLTITYHAVNYRNYHKENQKLIDEIDRKHKQLEITARKCLHVLNQLETIDDSISDDPMNYSSENNDISTSSTLTDDEGK